MRSLAALACAWVALLAAVEGSSHVHSDQVLRSHMSTKTFYPKPTRTELLADDERRGNISDSCRVAQLNFVVRHGTRYPTIKDIKRIAATHAKLASRQPRPYWVTEWDDPYHPDVAGWLALAGVNELIGLGQRSRDRFGDAMHSHFHADKFVFEHTYKPRTKQSAMAFSYGFFGTVQPVHYAVDAIGEDHELRFFDNCPLYDQRIDTNKSATVEHAKYRKSNQMKRNLDRFRQLAGDTNGTLLTQKDMEAAYAGCAFDVAVRGLFNAWCSLFDDEMLYSMDYFHDLKHFYKKGHGHALAFEIAAPLLQDVHRSMVARMKGESDVEGHFRFAHAETILPLASLLNLSYFDRHASDAEGHFLADTPLSVAMKRQFRGSALAPFAANIGFVLYECDGTQGTHTHPAKSYFVQTLLHERTVRFPDCGGAALCPFAQFEAMFSQWIHEYDFFSQCAAL